MHHMQAFNQLVVRIDVFHWLKGKKLEELNEVIFSSFRPNHIKL